MEKIIKLLGFFLLLCFISLKVFGQEQDKHINFILFIDDCLIINDLNNSCFITTNEDTISLRYSATDFVLNSEAYEKLSKLPWETEIIFYFKYTNEYQKLGSNNIEYKINLRVGWIKDGDMILKIYNFRNKKNWKYFIEREGYGFEFKRSSFYRTLARKKHSKKKRCDCPHKSFEL